MQVCGEYQLAELRKFQRVTEVPVVLHTWYIKPVITNSKTQLRITYYHLAKKDKI